MPTYSIKRPVKILTNPVGDLVNEHLANFYNTVSLNAFNNMTQEEKERVYELLTDYEDILTAQDGDGLLKSSIFLPKLLRDGIDNELVRNYKIWLDNR
jgi:hypothetical protein